MTLVLFDDFSDLTWTQKFASEYSGPSAWTSGRTVGAGKGVSLADTGRYISYDIPSALQSTETIVGFWADPSATNGGTIPTFLSDSGVTTHLTVRLTATGDVQVYRGGSTLVASTGATSSAQAYFEIYAKIDDSTGAVKIWRNGSLLTDSSSLDTRNGGTSASVDRIKFVSHSNSLDPRFGDVYIATGTSTPLGEPYMVKLAPTSDGANTDLTPSTGSTHYTLVDEDPINTTDYVSSGTDGHIDTYGFATMTPSSGVTVHGLQIMLHAQKSDSGSKAMRAIHRDSDTTQTAGANIPLSTSWLAYTQIWETNPNGSAAWTPSTIDGSEFGIEVRP